MTNRTIWVSFARKVVKVTVVLSLSFIFFLAYNMVRYRYGFADAFFSALLWPIEDTRWADGFTEQKFDIAARSETEDDLVTVLGKPLVKVCMDLDGSCAVRYTWTGQRPCCLGYEGYFHRREFRVDRFGHVLAARREFDLD